MMRLRKKLAVLLCLLMVLSDKSMIFAQTVQDSAGQNRTITLDAGKGEVGSETITLVDGKLRQQLPNATRTGWTFEGWYTAKVTENFWGDEENESFSALLKKCNNNRDEAVKKDFTWIVESEGTLVEAGETLPANVDTLYAMYKPTNNITIKWYYNGWKKNTGIFLTHDKKEYDSPLVAADLERAHPWDGHQFTGWYTKDGTKWEFDKAITDTDRESVYYISSDVVTKDLELYAHWTGSTDPDTLQLKPTTTGLVEPGDEISVKVSYSPVSADAPKLDWSVDADSDIVALKEVSDDGLKITLTINEHADVIKSNKSVTVTATSRTNPSLSAETSISIGHSWKLVSYEDSACGKDGAKHYQCTKHKDARKDVIIESEGHRFVKSERITKEPTCVDDGSYTDIYTCIVCNATEQVVTEIPATGQHDYDKTSTAVIKKANCGNNGLHTDTYTCTVCKATKTEHVTDPATGDHDFYEFENLNLGIVNHYQACRVCGKIEFLYAENKEPDVIDPDTSEDTSDDPTKEPDVTIPDNSGKPVGDKDYTNAEAKPSTKVKADNAITALDIAKTYSKKAQSFSIGATTLGNAELTYSSNNKSVTVDNSGKVTVKAKFIGKATITIKSASTAEYNSASKKIAITVNPSKPTISSVKNAKGKKLLVKWKKNTAVTGYQIQYSTDRKFQNGAKTVAISKNSTSSKTIKSLKTGATYNVRIRTYKTVSGTKYYSEWSKVKKVKISK